MPKDKMKESNTSTFLRADEGFLSGVQPLVGLQLTTLDKRLPTVWVVTQIRPLSCTQTCTTNLIFKKKTKLKICHHQITRSRGGGGDLTCVRPLVSLERLFSWKHAIADVTANTAGRRFPLAYELSDGLGPRASSSDPVLTARTHALAPSTRGSIEPRRKRPV